jgi:steroid delta-isomerase-like uncharacterized protein
MAANPEATDSAAVARAYFAAVTARDVEAMAACWEPGSRDVIHGTADMSVPDDLRTWFTALFASFPDFTFKVLDLVATGDKAAVHWHATGTFNGSARFEGMVPNGKTVDIEGCDVLTVRDGLVVHNDAFMNAAEMMRQLGALPPVGSPPERAMLGALNAKTKLASRLRRSG